jgi:hypothetical protein
VSAVELCSKTDAECPITPCSHRNTCEQRKISPHSYDIVMEQNETLWGRALNRGRGEAIDWMKRYPNPHEEESEIEIRQFFELEDFGASPAVEHDKAIGKQPVKRKHHDTGRQGDVSDDGRVRRIRAVDDTGTSPCRACPGQGRGDEARAPFPCPKPQQTPYRPR